MDRHGRRSNMLRSVFSALLTVVLACQSVTAGLADDGKKPKLVHFAKASLGLKKAMYAAAKESCLVVPDHGLARVYTRRASHLPQFAGWVTKSGMRVFRYKVSAVLTRDIYVMDLRPPVAVRIPGATDLAEGDLIFCVASDKGTYEYESVGGSRRLKYWESVSERITPKAWQKALQDGKSYMMELWIDGICPECRGLSNRRNCKRCKATGKVHEIRKCKIVW
jgi:hypothetical protein